MNNVREIISNNIVELRKAHHLSQAELGNALAYSDKTISKWERGESLPDIETLTNIAEYFKVDLNFFIVPHDNLSNKVNVNTKKSLYKKSLTAALLVLGILFICTTIFMYGYLSQKQGWQLSWLSFMYFAPISTLTIIIYMRKYLNRLSFIILLSILLWSFLSCVYVNVLMLSDSNIWMLFISGAPVQAAIILLWFFKFDK